MATTIELLRAVLLDLKRIGNIEASAVVSRDGLVIASDLNDGEVFAAMSATMVGAAETATSELKKGAPNRVIVESKDGKLIATGAGPKAILVVLTSNEMGLGLVLVEMSKASEKIRELIA